MFVVAQPPMINAAAMFLYPQAHHTRCTLLGMPPCLSLPLTSSRAASAPFSMKISPTTLSEPHTVRSSLFSPSLITRLKCSLVPSHVMMESTHLHWESSEMEDHMLHMSAPIPAGTHCTGPGSHCAFLGARSVPCQEAYSTATPQEHFTPQSRSFPLLPVPSSFDSHQSSLCPHPLGGALP